jgi:holo-[acyl-carrier protein] synthase
VILGLGIDLTDRRRIEKSIQRFGTRFLKRIFTADEQALAERRRADPAVYYGTYAKRFAAKEAAAKALGTGLGQGVSWQDIEVRLTALGRPELVLHRRAAEHLVALLPGECWEPMVHLALTDEGDLAMAQVILSAVPLPPGAV